MGQDSPGRFEVGGSFTALRNPFLPSNLGPGVEGDLNIGRHIALDAAVSWLPSTSRPGQTVVGLFGAKIGTRTDHFGFFAKVRPGFFTTDNELRSSTFILLPPVIQSGTVVFPPPVFVERFDRLTQRALDLGGIVEYYPSRHWALRWDAGDTLFFEEKGPIFTNIVPDLNVNTSFPLSPARTSNHFQFSASLHYRF
jgi:hypothetical protein